MYPDVDVCILKSVDFPRGISALADNDGSVIQEDISLIDIHEECLVIG